MALPLWDKVRLDTDERLDKPDAMAMQSIAMESVVNGIGGLLGRGGGCATPPTVTFDLSGGTKLLKLGGFQYYVSEPILSEASSGTFPEVYKGTRGNVMKMDPANGGQITDVDFTSVYAIALVNFAAPTDSMYPFLYAQPYEVDAAADARIKWVGGETPSTINTRTVIRHRFKFSPLSPDHADNVGWAPIVQIQWPSISGSGPGAPAVRYISFLDNPQSQDFTDDTESFGLLSDAVTWPQRTTSVTNILEAKQSGAAVDNSDIVSDGSASMDVGLIQIMQMLRSLLVRSKVLDRSRYWYQKQAGTDPAVAKDLKVLIDWAAETIVRPYPFAAGVVIYAAGYSFLTSGAVPGPIGIGGNPAAVAVGVVRVPLAPELEGTGTIRGVNATLYGNGSGAISILTRLVVVSGVTYVEVTMADENQNNIDASFSFVAYYKRVV